MYKSLSQKTVVVGGLGAALQPYLQPADQSLGVPQHVLRQLEPHPGLALDRLVHVDVDVYRPVALQGNRLFKGLIQCGPRRTDTAGGDPVITEGLMFRNSRQSPRCWC